MKKYRKTKLGGRNVASISTVTTTKILLDYIFSSDESHPTLESWIVASPEMPTLQAFSGVFHRFQVALILPQPKFNVVMSLSSATTFAIYDLFYSHQSNQMEVVKFAKWSLSKGLFMLEVFDKEDELRRLRGRSLVTAGFTHLPHIRLNYRNGTPYFSGYKREVFDMLFENLNVQSSMLGVPEAWGDLMNGTYTDLLGILYRKEIDISLNGFMRSTTRDQAARFIIKFGPLDLSIAYTMPPSVIPPTTYLLPFHFTVWILCFSALVCSLAMLAVVMLYSPIWQSSGDPTIENHTNYFRLLSGVFFELALEDPPGLPARIVHGTLLVATMAIFIFYTSVFTSFLAHRDLKLPIETLDDLIDNTDYRAVTVRSTVYYGMFKNSKAGVFYKLWNTKFQNSDKSSVQETVFDGILQMYYGMYVLALDSATIVANMNNNCSILLLRTPYLRENMQLVVRNDFPYNRILHDKILRMTEQGILYRLGVKYMINIRPPCHTEDTNSSFGIDQVIGLFFLLLCGVVLSLITLAAEVIIHKYFHATISKGPVVK